MRIQVFYRMSDKGRPKEKLDYASKIGCLENAILEFGKENIYVFADNCNFDTVQYLINNKITYEETHLGNSGSFIYMCEYIFNNCSDDDYIYLLEDDYVHREGCRDILEEGLQIAEYVTLYDHPDYYEIYGKGPNPLNYKNLIESRLYVTKSSHWRECPSSTMTFATKVEYLKSDFRIWKRHTANKKIPDDFGAWCEITQKTWRSFFCLFHAKMLGS